ncbi:hypothetical protein J2Y86_001729 [Pseudomonas migulae]|nr:hypothetical protein [Pseudomonas migulae]
MAAHSAGIEPNGLQWTLSVALSETDRLYDMENTRRWERGV